MKYKLFILVGVLILSIGLRLRLSGLNRLDVDGTFTVYNLDGSQRVGDIKSLPKLNRFNETIRLDFYGGNQAADRVLDKLNADIIKTENVDGITVIYAYSDYVEQSVKLFDKSINVMIAIVDDKVVLGAPIIKGSY